MSNLDTTIAMPSNNEILTVLLSQMGPERTNMAFLEIVDIPIEPLPPNIELSMILSRVEPYTSTCSTGINNNLTNQLYDPMTDIPLSIETGELESSNQQSVVDIANAAMDFMADQTKKTLPLSSTTSAAQTGEIVEHKDKPPIQSPSPRSDQFAFSQNVIPDPPPIRSPVHSDQFQLNQNVTSDPPSLRTPFINNDMRTPTIVTEWPFPDAWSTDEITASIRMQ